MNVSAVGTGKQCQTDFPTSAIGKEKQNTGDISQISKLNAEIKQAEAEVEETLKEVQKACEESIGGSSDKAQMLQSKLLMQQQEIMTKQIQVKKIESPKDSTIERFSSVDDSRSKFDRYAGTEGTKAPDNVYRPEEKDGVRIIIFNRFEE